MTAQAASAWNLDDEAAEVHRRRYREAREAGMTMDESLKFAASSADIGELRCLVEAGCDPAIIARIVL